MPDGHLFAPVGRRTSTIVEKTVRRWRRYDGDTAIDGRPGFSATHRSISSTSHTVLDDPQPPPTNTNRSGLFSASICAPNGTSPRATLCCSTTYSAGGSSLGVFSISSKDGRPRWMIGGLRPISTLTLSIPSTLASSPSIDATAPHFLSAAARRW